MAEVYDFTTKKRVEGKVDKIKLDPNKALEFTALFAKRLRENPSAKQEEKFEIWKELAAQTKFWKMLDKLLPLPGVPALIQRIQWISFEQELIVIRQFSQEG